jgi:hypothetical protein
MVAAMIVGMAVLAPAWVRIFALLGYSSLLKNAVLHELVMATDMTIGMSLWMRHRGHGRTAIGEMAARCTCPSSPYSSRTGPERCPPTRC